MKKRKAQHRDRTLSLEDLKSLFPPPTILSQLLYEYDRRVGAGKVGDAKVDARVLRLVLWWVRLTAILCSGGKVRGSPTRFLGFHVCMWEGCERDLAAGLITSLKVTGDE